MKTILAFFLALVCFFSQPLQAKPITLVWQIDRTGAWEEDWLKELLTGLDVQNVDDGKYKKYVDNSIVITSVGSQSEAAEAYFKKLHHMKYKFGIIHLSDEYYKASTSFYKYAKFVFRNYWHKKFISQKKVTIFPLGYKTGFWKDGNGSIKAAVERDFTWSFAGQITKKPTREAMVSYLKEFPHFHIHETFAWADPNSLDVLSYRKLLLNSIFVPCPMGWWNLDSFRIYEALECGCIPIVEKQPLDYFTKYFGDHPFIAVDSWDQAPALMKAVLADPILLEQRRLRCYEWWQAHKRTIHEQWIGIINQSLNGT